MFLAMEGNQGTHRCSREDEAVAQGIEGGAVAQGVAHVTGDEAPRRRGCSGERSMVALVAEEKRGRENGKKKRISPCPYL